MKEDKAEREVKPPMVEDCIPPGGNITTASGYLRRVRSDSYQRKWSQVPVGPTAARDLSKGLTERDHAILLMSEKARILTTEQIARAFFDSPVTARKRIRFLRERRFLASPEVDHRMISAAIGRRHGIPNVPLVLDWNGKYLLEQLGHDVHTWDPTTVAQVNSRFGHAIGISEVWSYMVGAARATHEQVYQPQASNIPEAALEARRARGEAISVGLLGERESVVYYEGRTGWSLEQNEGADQSPRSEISTQAAGAGTNARHLKYKPLVKPDATFVLSIAVDKTEQVYLDMARKSNTIAPSEYQASWQGALLQNLPSADGMRTSEQFGGTRYRYLFLEMETGSNSAQDMKNKIGRYNQLYSRLVKGDMTHMQNWRTLFGQTIPAILVAVRNRSQIEEQVTAWRTHYAAKSAGTVLLANIELLAVAYAGGRSRLLRQPCWLDVMRPEGPKWTALSEVFSLSL